MQYRQIVTAATLSKQPQNHKEADRAQAKRRAATLDYKAKKTRRITVTETKTRSRARMQSTITRMQIMTNSNIASKAKTELVNGQTKKKQTNTTKHRDRKHRRYGKHRKHQSRLQLILPIRNSNTNTPNQVRTHSFGLWRKNWTTSTTLSN